MTGPGVMADLSWLLDNFADEITGVAHVVVVSSDGLLLAASRDLPADRADQLATITAGLVSLAYGTSRNFDGGNVQQTIVHMTAGYLIVMSIGDGSALVVLAARNTDVGHVGYEMTLLVDRVGKALMPEPRNTVAR
ncbi:roadblock/LC7 domain-containing protein [Dactylosporangium sp. CA-092794]|uniref:roadblock/LC7 domain-containing protein n=1 Tax=Dactylosporangium sp. CA-092794 TaxID=3239929 RepID=UPI003D91BE47